MQYWSRALYLFSHCKSSNINCHLCLENSNIWDLSFFMIQKMKFKYFMFLFLDVRYHCQILSNSCDLIEWIEGRDIKGNNILFSAFLNGSNNKSLLLFIHHQEPASNSVSLWCFHVMIVPFLKKWSFPYTLSPKVYVLCMTIGNFTN